MLHPEDITGVILAGGKSSRFGSNKALSLYKEQSFLMHIIEQVQPYTKEVVVAGFYPEYENIGVPVLKDRFVNAGPLGGIYTALTYSTTPWVLVLTCDMPLMTNKIIRHMLAVGRGESIIGYNVSIFPLLISKCILPYLETAMEMKQYKVKQLVEWGNSKMITIPEEWKHLFANINTIEEYKKIIL
jgi:Molybdopterin-guanine dinucleotide biosynthesis protein A